MPMTLWSEIAGHRCSMCDGPATHFYGNTTLCCECHIGMPDEGVRPQTKEELEKIHAEALAVKCGPCGHTRAEHDYVYEMRGKIQIARLACKQCECNGFEDPEEITSPELKAELNKMMEDLF
jgi:hypothetical protein